MKSRLKAIKINQKHFTAQFIEVCNNAAGFIFKRRKMHKQYGLSTGPNVLWMPESVAMSLLFPGIAVHMRTFDFKMFEDKKNNTVEMWHAQKRGLPQRYVIDYNELLNMLDTAMSNAGRIIPTIEPPQVDRNTQCKVCDSLEVKMEQLELSSSEKLAMIQRAHEVFAAFAETMHQAQQSHSAVAKCVIQSLIATAECAAVAVHCVPQMGLLLNTLQSQTALCNQMLSSPVQVDSLADAACELTKTLVNFSDTLKS